MDQAKRYEYLLGKSEIFKHFLKKSDLESNINSSKSINNEKQNKNLKSGSDQRHHRKTEKEEDAELLGGGGSSGKGSGKRKGNQKGLGDDSNNNNNNIEDSEEKIVYGSVTESPFFIQGKMRDYQLAGLNWLIQLYDNGLNGILADEMVKTQRKSDSRRNRKEQ